MARLIRATYRRTVLKQVARTSRAMTWKRGRHVSIFKGVGIIPAAQSIDVRTSQFVMARLDRAITLSIVLVPMARSSGRAMTNEVPEN
jgi:hypothetical protein